MLQMYNLKPASPVCFFRLDAFNSACVLTENAR